jgi:hypothetical protein
MAFFVQKYILQLNVSINDSQLEQNKTLEAPWINLVALGSTYSVQVLQSECYFSYIDFDFSLFEMFALEQMREQLATTYILCKYQTMLEDFKQTSLKARSNPTQD